MDTYKQSLGSCLRIQHTTHHIGHVDILSIACMPTNATIFVPPYKSLQVLHQYRKCFSNTHSPPIIHTLQFHNVLQYNVIIIYKLHTIMPISLVLLLQYMYIHTYAIRQFKKIINNFHIHVYGAFSYNNLFSVRDSV